MKFRPRLLLGLALLAALVWALIAVTFRTDPLPVDLHVVARSAMMNTIDADGVTRIRNVYEVSSPISGTALRAPVEVGDEVAGGETLVAIVQPGAPELLDTRSRVQAEAGVREAEAAFHVAESDLRKAEEDLAYAQSQYDRALRLTETGTASLTRLEDAGQRRAIAEAARDAAKSRLEMATGSVDRAQAALMAPTNGAEEDGSCCIRLTAPTDGVVLDLDMVSERPVMAGTRLLSIGDPQDLQIVADLLSRDAVRLAPGARALVERWGGPQALDARLVRIEPAARTKVSALGIEEQRVDAIFDLVSAPEARPGLGHGFSVFLRIVEWETEDVLQVPLSALFRQGDAWALFVQEGGMAELRTVEVGRRNAQMAEILSGLDAGTPVIMHPNDRIADGVPVVDREAL